jgi:nickel-dependent lactate racemase
MLHLRTVAARLFRASARRVYGVRMRCRLDFGTNGLEVTLPDERVTVIEPISGPAVDDPIAALRAAIRAPLGGGPPLAALARPGRTIAISVCDVTRAQPRREMLTALFHEMPDVRPEDVTILIATGTHRANTAAELEWMLGREILDRYRVINHDARDASMLLPAGRTSTGVGLWLNRFWLGADVRITTGFVEPHFFAGFSGGPKMVAPGLAGLDTVMTLHDAARIAHPRAVWGVTEGNPIHEDVREIARMTGVHFSVDVTLNREHRITNVFAGDLFTEHAAACAAAKRSAMRAVPAHFDIVLTSNSGYPLDQNLYQAVKGMSAAARVVKPGGTIICAAECRDGWPSHGSYRPLLLSQPSPAALLAMIMTPGYAQPDQWQVQIQAQIASKARVLVKAHGLSPDELRTAHVEPVTDLDAALSNALTAAGPEATLCVLPQGPQTIPYLANE